MQQVACSVCVCVCVCERERERERERLMAGARMEILEQLSSHLSQNVRETNLEGEQLHYVLLKSG